MKPTTPAEEQALTELVFRLTPGPKRLREIGLIEGLSTERCRQLQVQALAKLRKLTTA